VVAVARLFLDNVDHVQASWVKSGDAHGLKLLNCGADDFMGTILRGDHQTRRRRVREFRSFDDYVDMITAIGRTPVERSTDYRTRRRIDPDDNPHGPRLGPRADGTPMLSDSSSGGSGKSGASGASDGESSGADD